MKQVIVVALLLGFVTACSPSKTESKMKTYRDEKLGFQLRYPDDWEKVEAGGTVVAMFSGAGTNRQISISHEDGGEKEIAAASNRFLKTMPACKEIEGKWRDVKGRRAYVQIVCWNSPIGDNKAIRLYVPAGDHFFLVTGMTPLKEFDRYASMIEDSVLSFEVTLK